MKNVLIIFGGNSSEHDISCVSAKSILSNIDTNLFNVTAVGISKDNNWYIYNDKIDNLDKEWFNKSIFKVDNIIKFLKQFDVVFPITHGNNGEDGKLEGFFDLFNIKYVGSKTLGSAICFDKESTKIFFKYLNINQVPFITIYNEEEIIEKDIDYPVIIKPANGGSSIGINKANNVNELKEGINEAFKYDKKVLIEKFIDARELEVAVLKDNNKLLISDVGEIVSCNCFYDYNAKYEKESKLEIPANIDSNIKMQITEIAKKVFNSLNLDSYARIDFFLENNNLYINEINTIPGFTEISMYPKLMINEGISYTDLITKLIRNVK